ncbi:MAG: RNA-binding S4 domain-containing protein [Pseudomonadota bacterium]|nr:RNA-binding S4 domain-containing protein [Pseudomonadota bacterium]
MADTGLRLDRWLWFARVVKSRTLAARLVEDGKVRLNRERVTRASRLVHAGDVITASLGSRIRVLRILDLATRRGPASEAATLYEDITPAIPVSRGGPRLQPPAARAPGAGRPTKRDRRRIDALLGGDPDTNT